MDKDKYFTGSILLHIPHSSAVIPEEYIGDFTCPQNIPDELNHMTDWYTNQLFDINAPRLVFPLSRLVCDVERFRDDSMEEMSRRGMGVCYTHGYKCTKIRELSAQRKAEILELWYDPHHKKLTDMTDEILERFDRCLIIDCHSFSEIPLPYEPDRSTDRQGDRPDICIGTDSFHTPEYIADALVQTFTRQGYITAVNRPYSCTMVPMKFYQKDKRVASVMIEINRGLYMDREARKKPSFYTLKQDITEAMEAISAYDKRFAL